VNINNFYRLLADNPRVNFYEGLSDKPWGERSFRLKDPAGNEVEIYQRLENIPGESKSSGEVPHITDEFTAKLYCADVEALTGYYQDTLQMDRVYGFDHGPHDRGVRLKAAGGFLELLSKKEKMPQGPAILTIESSQVDQAYKAVVGRSGVDLVWDMEDTWYGIRMFQVRDKEGNMTEIISYKRNHAPGRKT
jgi:uncharacterized glyoxalase superfamily protein PhnB